MLTHARNAAFPDRNSALFHETFNAARTQAHKTSRKLLCRLHLSFSFTAPSTCSIRGSYHRFPNSKLKLLPENAPRPPHRRSLRARRGTGAAVVHRSRRWKGAILAFRAYPLIDDSPSRVCAPSRRAPASAGPSTRISDTGGKSVKKLTQFIYRNPSNHNYIFTGRQRR